MLANKTKEDEGSPTSKKLKYLKTDCSTLKRDNSAILTKLFSDVSNNIRWQKVKAENLDLDYTLLLPNHVASKLFNIFEEELEYFTGELAKIKVFGKCYDLPRKQCINIVTCEAPFSPPLSPDRYTPGFGVTYGDDGLTYKYSGLVTPARPWPPSLAALRDVILRITGHNYNFVLVNRYKDGLDKIGEHKDDEKDLDSSVPIASVSLGQEREFYFKHQDMRRATRKRNIDKVNLKLQHGSLLLMNPPTNLFWYHALPPRKNLAKPRINLTFRKILKKK